MKGIVKVLLYERKIVKVKEIIDGKKSFEFPDKLWDTPKPLLKCQKNVACIKTVPKKCQNGKMVKWLKRHLRKKRKITNTEKNIDTRRDEKDWCYSNKLILIFIPLHTLIYT